MSVIIMFVVVAFVALGLLFVCLCLFLYAKYENYRTQPDDDLSFILHSSF